MKITFKKNAVLRLALFSSLFMLLSCGKDSTVVTQTPNAAFSYTSVRSFPVTVAFHNNFPGLNTPGYSYRWVFGDGTTSTEAHPTHQYTIPDSYSVGLEETSPSGSGSFFSQLVLDAATPSGTSGRPMDDFTITVTPEFVVTFTDQSTNAGSRHWSFGDGTEATNPGTSFTHTFHTNGPVVVQLTATNGNNSDQSSATIAF